MDEITKYDNSNDSNQAILSCGAVCSAVQGGSKLLISPVDEISIFQFNGANLFFWVKQIKKLHYWLEITQLKVNQTSC